MRTITVPAVAVLVGDKNWWPSKTPREMLEAAQRWAKERGTDYEDTAPIPRQTGQDPDLDLDLDVDDGYVLAVQTASRVSAVRRDD